MMEIITRDYDHILVSRNLHHEDSFTYFIVWSFIKRFPDNIFGHYFVTLCVNRIGPEVSS